MDIFVSDMHSVTCVVSCVVVLYIRFCFFHLGQSSAACRSPVSQCVTVSVLDCLLCIVVCVFVCMYMCVCLGVCVGGCTGRWVGERVHAPVHRPEC